MRAARRAILGLAAVVTAIAGLLVGRARFDDAAHERFVADLRRAEFLEIVLVQDALELQLGLMADYDPLVIRGRELAQVIGELRDVPADVGGPGGDVLRALIDAQGRRAAAALDALEQFKTAHSLLRNSELYLPILVGELAQGAPPDLADDLNALLGDVLLYNFTPAPEVEQRLVDAVDALVGRADPGLELLVRHTRVVLDAKRRVDVVLRDLAALEALASHGDIDRVYRELHARARARVQAARLWLVVALGALLSLASVYVLLLVREEKRRGDLLLANMLPQAIVRRLQSRVGPVADRFEGATVLFADIVDFTAFAAARPPEEVVRRLNAIFSRFDALTSARGLEKIKTIGDAYMVAGGLPVPRPDHAPAVADLALAMLAEIRADDDIALRIGIHSGPLVAGVLGATKPSYDLWGDTVNYASRMESHGVVGAIQVSEATAALLGDDFELHAREVDVKGRGPQTTYLLIGRRAR
jgi:class 3 adenylate cyclase